MNDRSRLSRRIENKTKKSIFLRLAGIVIILILVIKFGIPALADASFFLFHANDKPEQGQKKKAFISPPELDALPTATNSATITISGTTQGKQQINLYINGELADKTDAEDGKTFLFKNVTLKEGDNFIQTKAIEKDLSTTSGQANATQENESDFSNSYTISFTKKTPTVSIDSPTDKQSFGKDDKFALVKGKTDIGNKVTVNDFWAIVNNDGSYSYNLPLHGGDNKITVKATDDANNETKKEITVTFNQ